MHRATSSASASAASSSSSPSSSAHRPRMRHLTREQLLKSLQILGPASAPLPSELPPSPPASRPSSPAPALKRRHDADPDRGQYKRARTTSISSSPAPRPHRLPPRPTPVASSSRHEPSEDGELKEEAPSSPSFTPFSFPTNFPARRPRRGLQDPADLEVVYQKCYSRARMFRYSSFARVAAAHPPASREYKALRVPPSPGTPYATNALLMARLELVDSILHFVYALWCKENRDNKCYRASWRTADPALRMAERKLLAECRDDREKAFVGLIQMLSGFVHSRKLKYNSGNVDGMIDSKYHLLKQQQNRERERIHQGDATQRPGDLSASLPVKAAVNSLPSPSTSTSSSSNSTPIGGHGAPPDIVKPENQWADTLPPDYMATPVNARFLWQAKSQISGVRASAIHLKAAQETMNLPFMAKHFPRTFMRVINTSLSPMDEHEPDFQDDECELYWPGQALTGEGLGWVCLMGMSMVKEFGQDIGYRGVDGVVPKTSGDTDLGFTDPQFIPN